MTQAAIYLKSIYFHLFELEKEIERLENIKDLPDDGVSIKILETKLRLKREELAKTEEFICSFQKLGIS